MKKPKLCKLIAIYNSNGNKLPFTARWHHPGNEYHGKLGTAVKQHKGNPNKFTVKRGWGPQELNADPAAGYGWIDPRIEDWKSQETQEFKSINHFLENLIGDTVKKKERSMIGIVKPHIFVDTEVKIKDLEKEVAHWKAKYIEARSSGYQEGLEESRLEIKKLKAIRKEPAMTQEKKTVTIVVNGTAHTWPKEEISYVEVVTSDVPDYAQHLEITYSVKYKRGEGNKPEGVLMPGASVKVKEGMIFSVSETGQS